MMTVISFPVSYNNKHNNNNTKMKNHLVVLLLFIVIQQLLLQTITTNAFVMVPPLPNTFSSNSKPTTTTITSNNALLLSTKGNTNTIESVLEDSGFGGTRLKTISSHDLPLTAEVYDCGTCHLCTMVQFMEPNKKNSKKTKRNNNTPPPPPRVQVQLWNTNDDDDDDDDDTTRRRIIDIGQIITIWDELWLGDDDDAASAIMDVDDYEDQLQQLYTQVSHRSKRPTLTKKQIPQLVQQLNNEQEEEEQQLLFAESILRKVFKAGQYYRNLVDSSCSTTTTTTTEVGIVFHNNTNRRPQVAQLLAQEEQVGGRLKRFGCIPVSWNTTTNNDDDDDDESSNTSITLINGGWIAVDAGVRAVTEAQKFVQRQQQQHDTTTTTKQQQTVASSSSSTTQTTTTTTTKADERILFRLECLAMGELFYKNSKNEEEESSTKDVKQQKQQQSSSSSQQQLEVDIRETLKSCQLPLTPQGAQTLLIQIGHWSNTTTTTSNNNNNNKNNLPTPWSPDTLHAALLYVQADAKRRLALSSEIKSTTTTTTTTMIDTTIDDGRINLTHLPSICIDQAQTSFRDDALGIRRRSDTGRRIVSTASPWEILIHITDVSDIYCCSGNNNSNSNNNIIDQSLLQLLQTAAMTRGQSRYDLPLGPLHLLPPMVLQSLALQVNERNKASQQKLLPNRCVTVWIYLDERTGQILDAGIERTLIGSPVALTYSKATQLLEQPPLPDSDDDNKQNYQLSLLLQVLERNLQRFSQYRQRSSKAARQREQRLRLRTTTTKTKKEATNDRTSTAKKNNSLLFHRTRAHRMVDAALDGYGSVLESLLKRANNAPIPRASGSGASARAGRVATAPLRRYVDGMAQRQALSVLCHTTAGVPPPLTKQDCIDINQRNNEAIEKLDNLRPVKKKKKKQQQRKKQKQQQQQQPVGRTKGQPKQQQRAKIQQK